MRVHRIQLADHLDRVSTSNRIPEVVLNRDLSAVARSRDHNLYVVAPSFRLGPQLPAPLAVGRLKKLIQALRLDLWDSAEIDISIPHDGGHLVLGGGEGRLRLGFRLSNRRHVDRPAEDHVRRLLRAVPAGPTWPVPGTLLEFVRGAASVRQVGWEDDVLRPSGGSSEVSADGEGGRHVQWGSRRFEALAQIWLEEAGFDPSDYDGPATGEERTVTKEDVENWAPYREQLVELPDTPEEVAFRVRPDGTEVFWGRAGRSGATYHLEAWQSDEPMEAAFGFRNLYALLRQLETPEKAEVVLGGSILSIRDEGFTYLLIAFQDSAHLSGEVPDSAP